MLKLHPRYLGMQSGAQGGDLKAGGPPEEVLQGSSQEASPLQPPHVCCRTALVSALQTLTGTRRQLLI